MKSTLALTRSFERPIRLLLVNQLTINIGFYMLMPYLAGHLSTTLALPTALVGLILGVRNLSQQGLFLLGGTLADRLGCKPLIVAGCALRTVAFALLGVADSLPVLLVASGLVGLAGALFNPAVRTYLAAEAGPRKVEAFAAFNAFYQLGILIGPLIGLVLDAMAFSVVCLTSAAMFAVLTVAQVRALPARAPSRPDDERRRPGVLQDWRAVLTNRSFLLFSLAMTGSYVLGFQVYLGLPLEIRRVSSSELGVTGVFVVSAVLTVVLQARLTAWAQARWRPPQAIARGLALMGLSFVPVAVSTLWLQGPVPSGPVAWAFTLAPALTTAALLSVATMIIYPFEMTTIAAFGGDHAVGTFYGLYSTLAGIGIATGNLLTGWTLDVGARVGLPALSWLALTVIGLACATAVAALDRTAGLPQPAQAVTA
ncbi:MFS transporter [Streptosporangium sp. NPDC020145]|uniref:MFS transporter n=1 Tax=Streptosporangium sp. NPDC020145 TaxID=3154694 RepID=UPI00341447A3